MKVIIIYTGTLGIQILRNVTSISKVQNLFRKDVLRICYKDQGFQTTEIGIEFIKDIKIELDNKTIIY